MKKRFRELWNKIDARGDVEKEFARLKMMYSGPNRFYHNLNHIKDCLKEFDFVRNLAQQPNLIELAIWYHDARYNTQSKDNEEQSAQLAFDTCLTAKLSKKIAGKVRDLILATKHTTIPNGIDTKILIDIDLSILGKCKKEFNEYERNIRKEYSLVPENKFKRGRKAILQCFLDRDIIYLTDFFKTKYEKQARVNLEKSIRKLS